ncbi:MAG: hypothetical protein ACLGIJ_02485 [Candidatus Limnocylindria bacterium]
MAPGDAGLNANATATPGGRPRDWDGSTYDRVADPMTRWGAAVLDRLPLAGDEHAAFVRAVADAIGEPRIDDVRLEIQARRAA